MAAFDFAKVKDPTFFKENVLNAHASFHTYASREEYRTGSSSLALKLDASRFIKILFRYRCYHKSY